jgi:hypothetical protein
MKKLLITVWLLSEVLFVFAIPKKLANQYEVTYQTVVNGTVRTDGPGTKVLCSAVASRSFADNDSRKLLPTVAIETSYVDYVAMKTYQLAVFSDGRKINTSALFSEYPELTETGKTDLILGYNCRHLKTSVRSNSIDIWYTTDLGVNGTPSMGYGLPKGLVLKIVRNGNYELVATSVKPVKKNEETSILPAEMGESVDLQLYRHRITENLITTVSVFNNEQISFGNKFENPSDSETEKTFKYSEGTVILKKVKLPEVPDDTQIFAELYQHSNGDAYDRTGSVFMIPTEKEQSFLDGLKNGTKFLPAFTARNGKTYCGVVANDRFTPLVEMMRFFTSFGIGHFNEKSKVFGQQWEDSTLYKQEVTELLPVLQGERWIGVFIGNYDKGGHKVSLRLRYYPGSMEISEKPAKKYWVSPLFNTLNVMEMSGQEYGTMFENDSLRVDFEVPSGVKNVQFRYISTGHGGWGGGDEFNQKTNTILLDNQVLFQYTPWRSDCATFRKQNPSSGNFWNGVTSSDYSRSGWCPGTATSPVYYPVTGLKPGKHQVKVAIPLGKNEGGSFSSWNVSGVLIGEYE